jgi:hypothetical protein
MEHIAGGHLAPDDVGGGAVPGQQADARRVLRVPGEREAQAALHHAEVDGDRQVVDHHVVLGEAQVVDHRHVRHRHVHRALHPAVGTDPHVLNVVAEVGPVVSHGVQLAAVGVGLRMGREGAVGEGTEERVRAHGFQLVGQLHWRLAGLHQGPGAPGQTDDVGVVVAHHVAIAVPDGAALLEPHAVHHARAHEPVVGGCVHVRRRVRAVAQVAAVQFRRQPADHLERGLGALLIHRGEVSGQVTIGHGGTPLPPTLRRQDNRVVNRPPWPRGPGVGST